MLFGEVAIDKFDYIKTLVRNGACVQRHGYRKAQIPISDRILSLTRDEGKDLEEALAVRVWERPDNHTTFEVSLSNGEKVYVFFSDNKAIIGKNIVIGNW